MAFNSFSRKVKRNDVAIYRYKGRTGIQQNPQIQTMFQILRTNVGKYAPE